MGKAKPLQIGSRFFPSRKSAEEYTRTIRGRYRDGERITGDDDLFLRDLINLHSDKGEKIDIGITHFTVGKDRRWGTTRCFYLVRRDGSDTDFSFDNCINGKNPKQDILDAFRHAVADQIISFKAKAFSLEKFLVCPLDGISLTRETCDVDHVPPQTFETLVKLWLGENNLSLLEVHLVPNADNQWARELRDEEMIRRWKDFHAEQARLRITSKRANRSRKVQQ